MYGDNEWVYEDDHAFQLACEQPEVDEDDCEIGEEEMEFEDDGQPSEYQEWQDYMGGDEYYDHSENSEFFSEDSYGEL